jgi:Tfp pilus assembly protein PilO
MKPEERQKFLLMLTLAAVGLFVGVNYVFTPLAGLWSARSAQIKELRTRVADGKKLIARETVVRSHWGDMVANALPDNTSLAEQQMLRSLDNWAHGSGAEIASIMPQWKSDSTNYLTLNCRVEANGTLGKLSQFLYSIEKSPALKVDSAALSVHDNTGEQLTLGLQISGLALVQAANQVKR